MRTSTTFFTVNLIVIMSVVMPSCIVCSNLDVARVARVRHPAFVWGGRRREDDHDRSKSHGRWRGKKTLKTASVEGGEDSMTAAGEEEGGNRIWYARRLYVKLLGLRGRILRILCTFADIATLKRLRRRRTAKEVNRAVDDGVYGSSFEVDVVSYPEIGSNPYLLLAF